MALQTTYYPNGNLWLDCSVQSSGDESRPSRARLIVSGAKIRKPLFESQLLVMPFAVRTLLVAPLPEMLTFRVVVEGAPQSTFRIFVRLSTEPGSDLGPIAGTIRSDSSGNGTWSADAVRIGATVVGAQPTWSNKLERKGGDYHVWFGTNRSPINSSNRIVDFSAERAVEMHCGCCRVTVPESHEIGSVGSRFLSRVFKRSDDRLRVAEMTVMTADIYWSQISDALKKCNPQERDVVVFLHGFNVSFHDAAVRAAQIGYDLDINGVMAFYSWPSQGNLAGYSTDEATIEASEGFITDYLIAMAAQSGAAKIHIIAHSMGNRALLRAIDRIARTAADRAQKPFNQIILAAADVDQDTFKRLSAAYQQVAERTTMYVCSKDLAVEASHWLHQYPRAGLTPPVLVVPGIDTINVSNLDLTLLGHGYVAEARALLTDIHALVRHGSAPDERFGLRRESSTEGDYWVVGR
jgi:esterase/lipase superfamily enzyme